MQCVKLLGPEKDACFFDVSNRCLAGMDTVNKEVRSALIAACSTNAVVIGDATSRSSMP
jgi:hypothetical protein